MSAVYPLRVEAQLDSPLSRWLWVVKWILAIPHYVVLAFLWPAFVVMSVVAFFGIVLTGRYPRAVFDFNVGVLRWSWRVSYYSYGALGTDRYPPFTLAEVPDYPAHLDVEYPEHLSRGLVLVKWWLLAIPHYLIVGILVSGAWLAWPDRAEFGGLIGVFVLVAGVALGVTGTYPKALYDLILGLNRWVLRVAAYAGLMTDEYPPFRLDMGGHEEQVLTVRPEPPPKPPESRWTGGLVAMVAGGALLIMSGGGLFLAGTAGLIVDSTARDSTGYLTSPSRTFTTTQYAITTDAIDLRDVRYPSDVLGDVRIRAESREGRPVFVGIARTADVERYLVGVGHTVVRDWGDRDRNVLRPGSAPTVPPGDAGIWVTSVAGTGRQSLVWEVDDGSWTVVVMNADAGRGVDVRTSAGIEVPALGWIAAALLAGAVVHFVPGIVLVAIAVRRAGS